MAQLNQASAVYKGSTTVIKIYKGTTQVWPAAVNELLFYYTFEGSGTTVEDQGVNNYDGTLSASIQSGGVMTVTDSAHRLTRASDANLRPDNAVTLIARINVANSGNTNVGYPLLHAREYDSTSIGFWISRYGTLEFDVTAVVRCSGGVVVPASSIRPTRGVDHLVALVYDGATAKIYIDGVQGASSAVTGTLVWPTNATYNSWQSGNHEHMPHGMDYYTLDDIRLYNRALSQAEIQALLVKDSSLIGWWRLNEGAGTAVGDSSGHLLNGTFTGSPTWITRGTGYALDLSGTAQYATVADNNLLDLTGAMTLASWVRLDALATTYIIKKATQDTVNGYELGLSSAGIPFMRFNQTASADTYRVNATTVLPTNGTWAHVCGTYNGTIMRIYVNGTQEATLTTSPTVSTNSVALGLGAEGSGFRPINGALDDMRIYNRALSAGEVSALASA